MTIKIGCLQMNSSEHVSENLHFVEKHLKQAKQEGVSIVQLPENFAQMPASSATQVVEINGCGEIQEFLQRVAAEYQISLIAGTVPIREDRNNSANPFARSMVVDSQGKIGAHYDKIHLFDVELPSGKHYRESDRYSAGDVSSDNVVVTRLNGLSIGLSVCYDLRFPELYRQQARQGVELICVPSAFTYDTGKAHWQTLLCSRAVENQSFVFAAAQTGEQANGRRSWGHSMIISPWGDIIAEADEEPGLISAVIDLTNLEEIRARFPALDHRRM